MFLTWDKVFLFFLACCITAILIVTIMVNFFPCTCEHAIEIARQGCLCP